MIGVWTIVLFVGVALTLAGLAMKRDEWKRRERDLGLDAIDRG